MTRKFFTIANILSISRAVLIIPFVLVMLSGTPSSRIWGMILLALAALTDKLDGQLARKYHETSEWGKILDPLADKIGVAAAALVLLWLGDLPLWFFVVLIVRDLLIFAGGMFLKIRWGVVLPSNWTGKWAVGLISLVIACAVLGIHTMIMTILIAATCVLLAASLFLYTLRFFETVKTYRSAQHGNN